MNKLKLLFLLFPFFCNLIGEEINFIRKHKPGTSFNAKISTQYEVNCRSIKKEKIEKKLEEKKYFYFDGVIDIIECNSNSIPIKIHLKPQKIEGTLTSKNINLFKNGYEDFSIIWNDNKMEVKLSKNIEATKEEIELLQTAFRSPSHQCRLDELLGEKANLVPGYTWKLSDSYLKKIFSEKGIFLENNDIQSTANLAEILTIDNINCARIEVGIKMQAHENFDFEYSARIILPIENELLPLKTTAISTEKIKINAIKKQSEDLLSDFDKMEIQILYKADSELKIREKK